MEAGEVVAGRFEIERLAGVGGMGAVYRAIDRQTGLPVGLKVMHEARAAVRFAREAELLAGLQHPAIVRYLTHGVTALDRPYLAMEWLEGESLAERLERQGMSIDETVALIANAADGIGAAHAVGIVHRDVKPSNLYLVDRRVDRVKLLDFGVARPRGHSGTLTSTGVVLGTPGYMAPEQVRGADGVDGRADVFSLGCILFKCLTGTSAFGGNDVLAILAKLLVEQIPRARELLPGVPLALDELTARMMSKDPRDRPSDAAAIAAELRAMPPIHEEGRSPVATAVPELTRHEQRLLSVVIAGIESARDAKGADETTILCPPEDWLTALRSAAAPLGRRVECLAAETSVLAVVTGQGSATDQAMQAARCAIALRAKLPNAPIALATGRGVYAGRWPLGDVIDRAVEIVRGLTSPDSQATKPGSEGCRIRLDEVTAALLGSRFEVTADTTGPVLHRERDLAEQPRTLMGKPTRCLGREHELGLLLATFDGCVTGPAARAVLVTAPAGGGKSRLRHELVDALRRREAPVEVWLGWGDPMSAGSPFRILGQAIRQTIGIRDGERPEAQQRKLRERVSRHVPGSEAVRVTEFLGEMLDVEFPDSRSVQLRSARQDALLMTDQIRRAWEDFIRAECSAQPVLLVLEDLHWGDLPTTRLIEVVLRGSPELPFMVLALARPEIRDVFPRLWVGGQCIELGLADLPPRASERLVRDVLGDAASTDTVRQIVEQAAGNPFFLEELIRAAADDRGEALPGTVMAMLQARLDRLDSDARRVLRAASVFGQVFWIGGVTALLGGADKTTRVGEWLSHLSELELLAPREPRRANADVEYSFRHSLVREAAYATLTDADRALGHRLAGEWLENAGDADALVLAEHFERGSEPARAIAWYHRAAEQALEGNDFSAVLTRSERATKCGAEGEELGQLQLLRAEAHRWLGETREASSCAGEAMSNLPRGRSLWHRAASEHVHACGTMGAREPLLAVARQLLDTARGVPAGTWEVTAWVRTAIELLHAGQLELMAAFSALVESIGEGQELDPSVQARIHQLRAFKARYAADSATDFAEWVRVADCFERAGDLRTAAAARGNAASACLEMGGYEQAESLLRGALAATQSMGLDLYAAVAKHNLGMVLASRGGFEEGLRVEAEAVEAFSAQGHARLEAAARTYLALILARTGALDEAEGEARRAVDLAATLPAARAHGLGALARVLLTLGRPAEALEATRSAVHLLDVMGGADEGESLIRLAHAEALEALGDTPGARDAISIARERVLTRADKISDPVWRTTFLQGVDDNAGILALASRWLG